MTDPKPISKKAISAALREAKKAAREAKALQALQDAAEKKAGLEELKAISTTLPPNYQAWGYVRTNAWSEAARKGNAAVESGRVSLTRLRGLISKIKLTHTGSLEEIVQRD